MKVYVFGNEDLAEDNLAFKVAEKIPKRVRNDKIIEFITVKPNEDLPFAGKNQVVIMDTIQGIDKVQIIEGDKLDQLVLSTRTSAHDFDLAFQLKYLKKLNKLGEIKIIGLPQNGTIDYDLLISILRKLVAQDIQGS